MQLFSGFEVKMYCFSKKLCLQVHVPHAFHSGFGPLKDSCMSEIINRFFCPKLDIVTGFLKF